MKELVIKILNKYILPGGTGTNAGSIRAIDIPRIAEEIVQNHTIEWLKQIGVNPIEPIYWDTGDGYIELKELLKRYRAEVVQNGICVWQEDENGDWRCDCNHAFCLNAGTPTENEFKFCCYCGKPLEECRFEAELKNKYWNTAVQKGLLGVVLGERTKARWHDGQTIKRTL